MKNKLTPIFLLSLTISLITGCSTLSVNDDITKHELKDPYEKFNRKIYTFNMTADKYFLKPVAKGYDKITPKPIDKAIGNFFSNLTEPRNFINNLLQGKFKNSATSVGRFTLNSTIGLLGLFDVASSMEIEQKDEDFGQTLAGWGVSSGPYLMLPFLGPSSIRGSIGLGVDTFTTDPITYIEDSSDRYPLRAIEIIDLRQGLLKYDDVLEQQIDPYNFIKNGYQQLRIKSLYDGNPPEQEIDDF